MYAMYGPATEHASLTTPVCVWSFTPAHGGDGILIVLESDMADLNSRGSPYLDVCLCMYVSKYSPDPV